MDNTKVKIQDLMQSDIPLIADTATKARQYTIAYKNGQLTKEEYDDLIKDLTNLSVIDKELFKIEVYRQICEAFEIIIALKSVASLL